MTRRFAYLIAATLALAAAPPTPSPSVDGLNTIDARETTAAAARKWVIDPYETVVISGWQTSRTDAKRFEFTTEDKSHGQALGRAANLGVISAVFFKERAVSYAPETSKDRENQAAAESAIGDSRAATRAAGRCVAAPRTGARLRTRLRPRTAAQVGRKGVGDHFSPERSILSLN